MPNLIEVTYDQTGKSKSTNELGIREDIDSSKSLKKYKLLHKFFGKVCLDIGIFDSEGKGYFSREWFTAPLDVIEEAIGLIVSGKIVECRYDYEEERIKYV